MNCVLLRVLLQRDAVLVPRARRTLSHLPQGGRSSVAATQERSPFLYAPQPELRPIHRTESRDRALGPGKELYIWAARWQPPLPPTLWVEHPGPNEMVSAMLTGGRWDGSHAPDRRPGGLTPHCWRPIGVSYAPRSAFVTRRSEREGSR